MKVLMINGSTKKNGTTFRALNEVAKTLEGVGISSEIVSLGANPVRDCAGCNHCQSAEENQCIFGDDAVNDILEKARSADGFVFGSPVYYAQPTGQLLSVLHRLFYAGVDAFSFKPGAAVVTLRRAGATASLDALNKFFTNACMPVVSSTYWNELHGPTAELSDADAEGLQTMCNLGRNMAWMLRCIEAGGKLGIEKLEMERDAWTNFNR